MRQEEEDAQCSLSRSFILMAHSFEACNIGQRIEEEKEKKKKKEEQDRRH